MKWMSKGFGSIRAWWEDDFAARHDDPVALLCLAGSVLLFALAFLAVVIGMRIVVDP